MIIHEWCCETRKRQHITPVLISLHCEHLGSEKEGRMLLTGVRSSCLRNTAASRRPSYSACTWSRFRKTFCKWGESFQVNVRTLEETARDGC
uniref:Uncharacterized protein n=1 Tax=Fundulus heteroclitus TaxID=8078 RepID=A0A3Q2PFL9_FUNHE